jgi:hypothetical protein
VGRLLHVREPFEERKDISPSSLNSAVGSGEAFGGSRPSLYIPGRGAGAGSLPYHLRLPSSLVSAS